MIKKMVFTKLLAIGIFFSFANITYAEIVNQATIKDIIIPAGDCETAIVAFNILVAPSDSQFETNCVTGFGRVKFSKLDKQLLSFIMLAYALNKKVGFYFNPSGTTLEPIDGHGSGTCELLSIWIAE